MFKNIANSLKGFAKGFSSTAAKVPAQVAKTTGPKPPGEILKSLVRQDKVRYGDIKDPT